MLPGPSSTQTVMLIALKRGGVPLAILTLLLWVFPAALIMGALSFFVIYFKGATGGANKPVTENLFLYIQPMSVGFVFYAAARMMQSSIRYVATAGIMVGSLIATLFIHSPWVFPGLLLVAGTISNFSNKRIPAPLQKPKKINWWHLWLFGLLFVIAVVLSELARTQHWEHGRIYNLFENFYRFGAIVFGGGQALLPLMLVQFCPPAADVLTKPELLIGYGMVQAVPGPVFSICSFVGGMAMHPDGGFWQAMGCLTATIAVFLPSTLLLFFLFPIYENLKHHVIIFRALEGINAAIVGIIWASGIFLFQSIAFDQSHGLAFEWSYLVVVIITFSMLYFTKIPAPLIVAGWLLLGWTLHQY
jgi:chromate transporter